MKQIEELEKKKNIYDDTQEVQQEAMDVIAAFNNKKNKNVFLTNHIISSLTIAQLKILYKWSEGVPAPSA